MSLGHGLTRREAIKAGATVVGAAASFGALEGCGVQTSSGTAGTHSGPPRRGGTITAGMITGGALETLNPSLVLNNVDALRSYQLFDRLFESYDDVKTVWPGLATHGEPNADASVWTLRLRDGVEWHDGSPFTADDVVWTFKTWSSTASYANQFLSGLVDFAKVRKRGRLVVEVPMIVPVAALPSILTDYNMGVVKTGSVAGSFQAPQGTGPFKFESFVPGSSSTFVANRSYFRDPLPYVDKVIINSSFTDEDARLNALLSGAINVMPIVAPLTAKTYEEGGTQVQLLRAHTPIAMLFTMRIDKGPFSDVRVRQAMRLAANRPELVGDALVRYGTVANDVIGEGCQYFASDLRRPHDPEKARALLKAAGHENLTFTLPTADVAPGYVESATLFAVQAAAAGINVKVDTVPEPSYFGNDYLTRPIGQDQNIVAPSLAMTYRTFFAAGGGYNTTHWGAQPGGERAERLMSEAIGELRPGRAAELWREVQRQQFDSGGQLAWGCGDSLDLVSERVRGLRAGPGVTLNNYRLMTGWIMS